MSVFTVDEVTRAAFSAVRVQSQEQFEKQASVFFVTESLGQEASQRFDIFLSHAFNDRTIVIGLYKILRGHGFSVYVDWIHDPQLNRQSVTTATAELLRQRLRQCRALLYATTVSSSSSRWMPWECGYYDGHDGHVAILPVLTTATNSFAGQEYLGLYPFSQKGSGSGRNALMIHNQTNPQSGVMFDLWIQGINP